MWLYECLCIRWFSDVTILWFPDSAPFCEVDQGILPGSYLTADISKFTEIVKLVDRIFSLFNLSLNLHLSHFIMLCITLFSTINIVPFSIKDKRIDFYVVFHREHHDAKVLCY